MERRLACPRSPHRSLVAASKLYCQLCWRPLVRKATRGYPQAHPCLFCPACRQQCARRPEPHAVLRVQHGHGGGGGSDREMTSAPDVNRSGQGGASYYQCGNSEILLNSSLIDRSEFTKLRREATPPTPAGERPIVLRSALTKREKKIFRKKLDELDRTATRCGFCPRDSHRRDGPLVSYCCFCGKHLCQKCHPIHSNDTLYKYHPTVDLTTGVNTALQ